MSKDLAEYMNTLARKRGSIGYPIRIPRRIGCLSTLILITLHLSAIFIGPDDDQPLCQSGAIYED